MRIVQIIDSLHNGGAEKMAVNYANSLANTVEFSGIIATRDEGNLKHQLQNKVAYLFLNKKSTLDLKALFSLVNFCKINKVEYLQPHTSSYFIAVLAKILIPKLKIIWHDHNGMSEFVNTKSTFVQKIASLFFTGIIVVNHQLKNWAEKNLNCKNVIYLPNFTKIEQNQTKLTQLNGENGKRILCLANLRPQKNHFFLIEIAKKIKISHPDWTFHLVGKNFNDDYFGRVQAAIIQNKLEETVFIYGTKQDVISIINQATICIFTSKSEGLPVALLEYGMLKKPVVSTKVGEIPFIINHSQNGFLSEVDDVNAFSSNLEKLIDSEKLRIEFGNKLCETITQNNSEKAVITKYINWIKSIS